MQPLLTALISACALIAGPAWSQPQPPNQPVAEKPAAVAKKEGKQEDFSAAIKKIANADSVGGAATMISDLLKADNAAAKTAIYNLFKAPATTDVVYEALCGVLAITPAVAEDPEALEGFGHGLTRQAPRIRDVVRGSLWRIDVRRRIDAGQGTLLKLCLEAIANKETDVRAKEAFVRIATELAQTRALDRLEATEHFLTALAGDPANGYRNALLNGFQKLTYRTYKGAGKSQSWLDNFIKETLVGDRYGFTHEKLLKASETRRNRVMSKEAESSIDRLVGAGILPTWYLDETFYPDALIRLKALDGIELIAGNDEKIRRETVSHLLDMVAEDSDEDVKIKAIAGLAQAATVLKTDLELRETISKPLLGLLGNSLKLEQAAVMGLARCYITGTSGKLAERYVKHLKQPEAAWPVRREIILALTEFKQEAGTVLRGLMDPSAEVRQVAGRSLSRFQIKKHAASVAQAWVREKDQPAIRRTYLLTLEQLANYANEDVISSLIQAAELKDLGQEDALRCLLKSLRATDDLAPPEPLSQKVITFLGKHVPANVPEDARRGLYTNELKASPPPTVAQVALLWAKNEAPGPLRTLAAEAVLRSHESLPLRELLDLGTELIAPADPLNPAQPATAPTGMRLLEALEIRAKLPNAPKSESERLPLIQQRIAESLLLSTDPKDSATAAQHLTALLKTTPEPATPPLLLQRAQAHIQSGQYELAAQDLNTAESRFTDATKPTTRKQLSILRSELSILTNLPTLALSQATQGLALPGETPVLTTQLHILLLKSALRTYDPKLLTKVQDSLTALQSTHPKLSASYQLSYQRHLQTLTHLATITTPASQTYLTTQSPTDITPYLLHTLRTALNNPTPSTLLPPLTLLHHHNSLAPIPPKSTLPALKRIAESTIKSLSK